MRTVYDMMNLTQQAIVVSCYLFSSHFSWHNGKI